MWDEDELSPKAFYEHYQEEMERIRLECEMDVAIGYYLSRMSPSDAVEVCSLMLGEGLSDMAQRRVRRYLALYQREMERSDVG